MQPPQKKKNITELNDELENYFRNTIIPQLFVDANLLLQKFTPPAMKQFNLKKDDIGKSIIDIKENFRFHSIIENIQQVIDSNEILEKEIQTTDMRWYQMNIIPYENRQTKKTNGVIITFVDITRRIKDLKEQEKLISDHETLLDTISHDIKTPLTSLVLAIEVFKKMSFTDEKEFQSFYALVENITKKLQNLINELTDTRKEEHKYRSEEQLLDFEHVLEDVQLTLTDNIRNSEAIIKSEVNVSEITFSRRKLRSILFNLVSNAIKFKKPGMKPEIFIKTEREGSYIIISVKDNGIGIEPEKQKAIFSKYYRTENEIEGSGIGLYLVKEIVQNSGGKISVESEKGKGSEFKVFLKEN
ncbi:MAG: PAS domain-containing protein [Bacteroidota bacterium]|nr:PAS domain-containing protein [Bacteroidota bacterium]